MRVALLASASLALLLGAGFAQEEPPEKKLTPEEVAQIDLGPSCITAECHGDMGKKRFQHGPMNFGKCEPCHIPKGTKHVFEPRLTGRALCLKCHELAGEKTNKHEPFTKDCSLCHLWHESDTRYHVKGGTGADGCLKNCHEEFPGKQPYMHSPIEKGGCLACHTSHQSNHDHLLTHERRDLCLLCHIDFPERLRKASSVHEPLEEMDCIACHAAHGSDARFRVPEDDKVFCRRCHEDVLARMDHLKYPHGAMVEKSACRKCHEPHVSEHTRLLAKPLSELCLDCHNEEIEVRKRKLTNIAKQMKEMKYAHGPIQQKNCVACHRAHGTDFPYLLRKDFPEGLYADYGVETYGMCFDCHDPRIVEQEKGVQSAFRNGERNLHHLHVTQKKGRTCRLCHTEHGGQQPKLIRPMVRFGQYDMPLEFTETASGGFCQTPCHTTFVYNRPIAWDNSIQTSQTLANIAALKAAGPVDEPASFGMKKGDVGKPFVLSDGAGQPVSFADASSPTLLLFLDPTDFFAARELGTINHGFRKHPEQIASIRRWVVLSSRARKSDIEYVERQAGSGWRILIDRKDAVFPAYHVIASPTAMLLDADRRVRLVTPGYALDVPKEIHEEIDRMFGLEPEIGMAKPLTVSELTLQMARRFAARGLWESALQYYDLVIAKEGSTFLTLMEQVEIYLEMREPDKAIALLKQIEINATNETQIITALKRAALMKAAKEEELKPPVVDR